MKFKPSLPFKNEAQLKALRNRVCFLVYILNLLWILLLGLLNTNGVMKMRLWLNETAAWEESPTFQTLFTDNMDVNILNLSIMAIFGTVLTLQVGVVKMEEKGGN